MKIWVSEDLKYLDLGDKRVNTRLGTIVSDLSEYPNETVPEAITSGAEKRNGNEYEEGERTLLSLMQVMVESYRQ